VQGFAAREGNAFPGVADDFHCVLRYFCTISALNCKKTKSWCEKGHRCKCATVDVSSKYQERSTSIFFAWKAVKRAGAGFIRLKIQHIMIFPVIFVAYKVHGWMEVQSVWVMAAYKHGYQSSKSVDPDLPAYRRLCGTFLTKKMASHQT
jgi:hypothetical protein